MKSVGFDDLIPAQQAVADSDARTLLVLGGAGVGKTTTALWTARRELTERGARERPVRGRRVLFVTFSRTAVVQIRTRAHGVLAGLGDSVEILTFHGLAYRLLLAFGRYVGIAGVPTLLGEARSKLAAAPGGGVVIRYDQLLPTALRLVESDGPIGEMVRSRWSLVICDEFQDTDDVEWRLLQALGERARLLLLADPNQMIYGFKLGVSDARLDAARARPQMVEVTLPPGSHRDPTQVLPDAAADVRWRRFDTSAVTTAVETGRLVVRANVPDDDDERAAAIAAEIQGLRADGCPSVGVYAKTNSDAAGLSVSLTAQGIDHTPIGFSEAYGEALAAMSTMVRYAAGDEEWVAVRSALATVLTASVRSPQAPPLAVALHNNATLPGQLAARADELRRGLDDAGHDITAATDIAVSSWDGLGILAGRRFWGRAGRTFASLASRAHLDSADPLARLDQTARAARDASFVELDAGDTGAIQLMNFSQTKGREADAAILSYGSRDWYGGASEPFDDASRLLYVSMTRARRRVVVILPPQPHALVAPFLGHAT